MERGEETTIQAAGPGLAVLLRNFFSSQSSQARVSQAGGEKRNSRWDSRRFPTWPGLQSHLFHFHEETKPGKILERKIFLHLSVLPRVLPLSVVSAGEVLQWHSNWLVKTGLSSVGTALDSSGLNRCFTLRMNHTFTYCHSVTVSQHIVVQVGHHLLGVPGAPALRAWQQFFCPGDVSVWSAHCISVSGEQIKYSKLKYRGDQITSRKSRRKYFKI